MYINRSTVLQIKTRKWKC